MPSRTLLIEPPNRLQASTSKGDFPSKLGPARRSGSPRLGPITRNGSRSGLLPEDVPDSLLDDISHNPSLPRKRLIVAVDFGTTFFAVSYVALEADEPINYLNLESICSIRNFPEDWNPLSEDDPMRCQVPTKLVHPSNRDFRKGEDLGPVSDNDSENDAEVGFFGQRIHSIDAEQNPPDISNDKDPATQALSRFKLMLDEGKRTETVRNDLRKPLSELKLERIISNDQHVIADFLTCLLSHTKSELETAGFDESYSTEMALCVPAIWLKKACRQMQIAMTKATVRAGFSGVENGCVENLFLVSDAAAYALAKDRRIMPVDTFVLIDAGGGTVDANTYTVSATSPLRLTHEVVEPDGGLGASYLNEEFRQHLKDLLADEKYLEDGNNTINGAIERFMIYDFESRLKRTLDAYTASPLIFKQFSMRYLRDNPAKKFRNSYIQVPVTKLQEIFAKPLAGIASLMESQITAAYNKRARVEKALIGGFAGSPTLKKFIEESLNKYCQKNECRRIALITPENTAMAVAHGAVLRAFDEEYGPQRHAKSSYGILRTEPYMDFPEHREATWWIDALDESFRSMTPYTGC
ncbi:hypothetical protein B0H63DRAFT_529720 [Podospora didyma]|uniref:Uncharacterized protein n=1 Tax=Podospora didyma TaxID=330526 RepID=A0AAE0K0X9_9PEZI|nr:hypothetical protein B0H63DRAFT_529720 [Podospora didyma]